MLPLPSSVVLRGLALLILAALPLIAGCPYGPRDLASYPPAERSPYVLPFLPGKARLCVQGNNGSISHNGSSEFSYDFYMPEGTPVTAARAGVVISVREDSNRLGRGFNNVVRVEHEDGDVSSYVHLMPQGALVEVGQVVERGEVIARSGWTGYAALPHLHFHVSRGGRQVPIRFRDVAEDEGVPRTGFFYRAQGPGPR